MVRALWIATWALVGVGLFAVTMRLIYPADLATQMEPARDKVFAMAGTTDPLAMVRPAEVLRYDSRLATHPRLTRLHILPGALFLLLAPLQFVPFVRKRYLNLHRWSGRFLMGLAAILMIGAFYFGVGVPFAGPPEATAIALFGTLFVLALARAWIAIRNGRQDLHREWMIRAFAMALAISTMRVVLGVLDYPLTMLKVSATGVFATSIWIGWLLNVCAAEFWIRRTRVPRVIQPRMSFGLRSGIFAITAGLSLFGFFEYQARQTTVTAGFWFQDFDFAFPGDEQPRFGGKLTASETETIKRVANEEVRKAFSGYRMTVSDNSRSFWRVDVVREMGNRLPWTGVTYSMGPMGGLGGVAFTTVAINALSHAPAGASRRTIVEGIGRGIGRAAVHELAHQILGSDGLKESPDETAYECRTSDRFAQYYGELRWTTALDALDRRIGPRKQGG